MENGKSHKVYRGSCRIMTAEQALNRAKEKKAKALDLENG